MKPCPELFELEAFFEVNHNSKTNSEAGWFYNCISFERQFENEKVICIIEPAMGSLSILHTVNEQVKIDVSLHHIQSLELSNSGTNQVLIGRISHESFEQLFKLICKPNFSFKLSTGLP